MIEFVIYTQRMWGSLTFSNKATTLQKSMSLLTTIVKVNMTTLLNPIFLFAVRGIRNY